MFSTSIPIKNTEFPSSKCQQDFRFMCKLAVQKLKNTDISDDTISQNSFQRRTPVLVSSDASTIKQFSKSSNFLNLHQSS